MNCIYQILNTVSNKLYIGSAVNIKSRWWRHKRDLILNKHPNILLQRAWNKYGEEAFEFKILQYVEDKNKLIKIEQNWIDWTKCCDPKIGYNLAPKANSQLGVKRSEETKDKLRKIKRTEEEKIRLSIFQKGRKRSEQAKLKMSVSRKGKMYNRNKLKWPHELGRNCLCDECRDKKKEYNRNLRLDKKNKNLICDFVLIEGIGL